MSKAIEPVGESKSDYEAVVEVAKKLGMERRGHRGHHRRGPASKTTYEGMRFDKIVTWEEFQEKDYFVIPVAKDWERWPGRSLRVLQGPRSQPAAHADRQAGVLLRKPGQGLPQRRGTPAYPQWIEKGITHDERISSKRAQAYPLLVISNHGRWRVHAQADDIPWSKEAMTGKVRGFDGYLYEPCWINPTDAAARGIKNGDIVTVYNERGSVLCGALVFERVMPGAVSIDHGARTDFIIPGKVDRGGAINPSPRKG